MRCLLKWTWQVLGRLLGIDNVVFIILKILSLSVGFPSCALHCPVKTLSLSIHAPLMYCLFEGFTENIRMSPSDPYSEKHLNRRLLIFKDQGKRQAPLKYLKYLKYWIPRGCQLVFKTFVPLSWILTQYWKYYNYSAY